MAMIMKIVMKRYTFLPRSKISFTATITVYNIVSVGDVHDHDVDVDVVVWTFE